jgi:hypothetical protein
MTRPWFAFCRCIGKWKVIYYDDRSVIWLELPHPQQRETN